MKKALGVIWKLILVAMATSVWWPLGIIAAITYFGGTDALLEAMRGDSR